MAGSAPAEDDGATAVSAAGVTEYGTGGFGGGTVDGGGAAMGGAIFNYGGTVTIINSTLANNDTIGGAADSPTNNGQALGGAIFNLNGSVTSDDSTLAYNTAADGGGAIYNHGDDPADVGSQSGGPTLPNANPAATLNNSILADSNNGSGTLVTDYAFSDINGVGVDNTDGTNNLIETGSANFTTNNEPTDTLTGNPELVGTAPANNGGPTDTFALSTGPTASPALDVGSNAAIPANTPYDQRGSGFDRISNTTVDLGAYEVQVVTPSVSQSSASQAATVTTLTITGSNFDTTAANNTVTFDNGAVGTVTSATSTSLSISFTTLPATSGSLTAVVTTDSQSSGDPVQVAIITPVVTPSTASIPINSTGLVINGFGLAYLSSTAIVANDGIAGSASPAGVPPLYVTFNDGAEGFVTAATATSLSVTFTTEPTAVGSLTAIVTALGQNSGTAVQVATVIPVVTQNTATIAADATGITINGLGFDATAANNPVTFNDGAAGTVGSATTTSLTVTFTTQPTASGSLTAIVTTDSQSSGSAVQVATITPVVTQNTATIPANATGIIIDGYGFDVSEATGVVVGSTTPASAPVRSVSFNDGASGYVTASTATSLSVTFTTDPTTAGS